LEHWEEMLGGQKLAVLDVPGNRRVTLNLSAEQVADRDVGEVVVLGEPLGQSALAGSRGA
jgi:hypothetical protein